jgi:hypothetical protein
MLQMQQQQAVHRVHFILLVVGVEHQPLRHQVLSSDFPAQRLMFHPHHQQYKVYPMNCLLLLHLKHQFQLQPQIKMQLCPKPIH